MGDSLGVEPAEMRSVQQLIGGVAEEMRSEFGKLARRGDELAEGWAGTSASKFRPPWEEWKEGCETVIAALEGESGLLGESADEYDQQEGENSQSLARVEPRFNF
ncbi:conserved hypothetical protein [Segniliparus rotundus DSM 44985]|uniref:ESAT-6-like protein n=1 Tax=Segniliparus rotundus (strain ATCC BAA-972 / CDC 1076 / CIP 108378 / DSM 44985 / JCM 13578) TaxID=640132 RepID=D6ZDK1_SEGRD|nr:WXG100 family type VII secretion target [Segniliparus rotundus]ADG97265.1 conserved hypothetical protein [Segniliparus rotundus DSM 44985]